MRAAIPARSSARACRRSPAFSRRSEPIVLCPCAPTPAGTRSCGSRSHCDAVATLCWYPDSAATPARQQLAQPLHLGLQRQRLVRRTAFTSPRAFASLTRAASNKPWYVPASQRASSSARRHRCTFASATAARASASSARPRSYRSCPMARSPPAAFGNDQLPSPPCTRVSPTPTSPIAMPSDSAMPTQLPVPTPR